MVELDGTVEVVGADGPVRFWTSFQGRDELVVYHSTWYDGAPHQGQCEGCTFNLWHMKDAAYLNARGVSFAVSTLGRWDEVASTSSSWATPSPGTRCDGDVPLRRRGAHHLLPARRRPRACTYSTTGRGNEPADTSLGLLDMTPYGRGEAWEDNPGAGLEGRHACWYWRSDADGERHLGLDQRPAAQWTRPGATPVETLGRHGHHY